MNYLNQFSFVAEFNYHPDAPENQMNFAIEEIKRSVLEHISKKIKFIDDRAHNKILIEPLYVFSREELQSIIIDIKTDTIRSLTKITNSI